MPAGNVLFTVASLHPEHGGPAQSVPGLGVALARAGMGVDLVALHYGNTRKPPLTPSPEWVTTSYVNCDSPLFRRAHWTPRFGSVLQARCRAAGTQILHDNGVWLPTNHTAAGVAHRLSLPLIISPRGMLTVWALQHKAWKKRLALALYQRRDLEQAQVLHATAATEAADFRAIGLRQPIAVIPNGIQLPEQHRGQRTGAALPPGARRTLLFVSRLHPKKGLLDLVQAWAAVRRADWRVVIAGGDEQNHRAQVAAAIRDRRLENDFTFTGEVQGDAKWELYNGADVFVLPSHSENFGIVVAEALACGLPVITTHGTPWEALPAHRCGWWVANDPAALAAALREAMVLDDEARRAMGARGRALVEQKFGWPGVAEQMLAVYQWMLGRGPARPA